MTPAPPAPGPPRPSSASPPGAAPRHREGERGPRVAEEAAERGTERAAHKATHDEGKAQRNGELGDRRGQPAGAHMGGEWHRRLRRGCGPRQVGLQWGPPRPGEKGMENWGRGLWGRGLGRREGGRRKGVGKGEAEGGPLRRRARGLPAGKGRAGAAAREGPRRRWRTGRVSQGPRKKGRGSRRTRMAGPERPPPPRGQGRLNRWGAGLQPLQLDFPL